MNPMKKPWVRQGWLPEGLADASPIDGPMMEKRRPGEREALS
jgi:hypothetical protein